MSISRVTPLRKLENMLANEDLPSFCREAIAPDLNSDLSDNQNIGDPAIEIIFPMNKERPVYDFLRRNHFELMNLFGLNAKFYLRTILYHLAYSRFSRLSSRRESYFLSTNVENLNNPTSIRLKNRKMQYRYNIREVIVDTSAMLSFSRALDERVLEVANSFNKDSKYIKIGEISIAYTVSSGVRAGDPPLTYRQLDLDERYLSLV